MVLFWFVFSTCPVLMWHGKLPSLPNTASWVQIQASKIKYLLLSSHTLMPLLKMNKFMLIDLVPFYLFIFPKCNFYRLNDRNISFCKGLLNPLFNMTAWLQWENNDLFLPFSTVSSKLLSNTLASKYCAASFQVKHLLKYITVLRFIWVILA